MRLLQIKDDGEFSLAEYVGRDGPPYAILSHTWGADNEEVTITDLVNGTGKSKAGYRKVHFCGAQAAKDGLEYFWIDTCCINKSSSAELAEAINSMFSWYRNASRCYVYLSDVSKCIANGDSESVQTWELAFRNSRWFTRGWTLQELVAPVSINFYSEEGMLLGNKGSLEQTLHEITGIAVAALRGSPLSVFSVEERLSWATNRRTKREEDAAYSLLGIFDVHMPLLYGEGRNKAFRRLQKEISESLVDELPASLRLLSKHEDSAQLPGQIMPIQKKFESGAISHHDRIFRPGMPKIAESIPIAIWSQLEDANSLDQSETEQPISDIETPGTMSPGPLYSHPLEEYGFRLFTLDPGVIGSQITGRLQEFSLLDAPAFNSLSYVWGQEPAVHRMSVNGEAVFVRPNLFHALQRVRLRTGHLRIWVDSLCINQRDGSERNSQVRQMATIYSKAEGVLIWLGEEDSTSKLAMEFVSKIIRRNFEWNGSWWEDYGFVAFAQILERPWFRRGWVLQEAAFSTNSTIYCGDSQVHMDRFALAVDLVRARFSDTPSLIRMRDITRTNPLANFQDSPAVRLLNTIQDVFRKSAGGQILYRRMSLETLVDLGRFSETTDHRDAIYALLNLANDLAVQSKLGQSDAIIPDYGKNVLDVYVDFILHCCCQSNSLDIICRPWAPISSSAVYPSGQDRQLHHKLLSYPSWVASRDGLPFGNPAWRLKHRLHGNPLVGTSQKRVYNAHCGTKPRVSVGRNGENGECDGSLYAQGIILGEISQRSTRLADAIISKECLEILGTISRRTYSNVINLPDAIWRTLCADRDDKGQPASSSYRMAMLYLLEISPKTPKPEDPTNILEQMSSIDVEELLDTDLPDYVKKYLMVVRDIVWNRRTFRSKMIGGEEGTLVGLVPQSAKVGDQVCILYGCSVPVILRNLSGVNDKHHWQLVGDAYVYGVMDGEAIESASMQTLEAAEVEFRIQ